MYKLLLLLLLPFFCFSNEFIVNGDFSTGDLTGWTQANQPIPAGGWYPYSGNTSPLTNSIFLPPPYGTYGAIADELFEASMVLYQDVYLPDNLSYTLTYTYYYENQWGAFFNPDTLDYHVVLNQQLRIDIMTPTSDPFSIEAGDVLKNLLSTPPGTPNTLGYTKVSVDISQFAGSTIRLRFANVNNQGPLLFGVDGVSISSENPTTSLVNATKKFNPFKSQKGP